MATAAALYLLHGPRRWALNQRPLTIGRQPECDITIPGDEVSRSHAYVVPTPTGPLLIDGSRSGTTVNGERMRAPWVLADGDEIQIGVSLLRVALMGTAEVAALPSTGRARLWFKVKTWLRRYGPSEVLGTIAAVGIAGVAKRLTGSTIVAAYAGTLAEVIIFYGVMFLRETIKGAHEAGKMGRAYGNADLFRVMHGMVLEFGAAEALDSIVLRPVLIGLGITYLGTNLGALAGKLAADAAFYGPVLTIYEWRLARGEAARQEDRRRRTTATRLTRPPE
jgi:hypothetical protein